MLRKKFSCVAKTERENESKLLSFEFNSFLEGRGRRRKKFVVVYQARSDTRKIDRSLERRKKKKDAVYANGSGPDPPTSSDTSVTTSPAFIDVFLPVRAARISSFPRALLPYLRHPNSRTRFLFKGTK